ncbi:hypothetical protein RHGRI_005414 [Rhododendron griersonianum]|uniref:Pentatricopeptide repeat-containing protein n=1 Tax=Rhododendron griersonianum TaxID=479676 RepID=A0AAV6LD76_9ERIC|nr:hypothetical protein RHGRI_005414 [Rhododendron griersonianum]
MNTLFSLRTRSTFVSKPFLPLQPTKNPNPKTTNRLISIQPNLEPSNPNPNHNPTDYTTISALLSNPTFPPGPPLETALDRAGIEPGPSLLQRVFDDFGSSPKQLLSLFIWAEMQPGYLSTVGIFNAMIKVLARAREFEAAWCLVLGRIKRGLEGPDADTFAILIRRFARAGMPSPAIRTLEFACSLDLIQCSNSELNLFEILLDSFCKEGLVLEASKYFNTKRATDPSWVPSIHVYNILLTGWFRARQFERVECLWDEMKSKNVKPSVVTYGTFIEGYCRQCRVEVAIEFFWEMNRYGIEPNAIVYNSIIDALGEAGRFKEALAMMERFLVLESGPTISTYNSLVKCFCRAGDIEAANKILKMMINRGFMPTITMYNYFLRHYLNLEKFEEGMNLYTKMMESGYIPDQFTYHILMILLCKQERLDLAMQVRKEMKDRGYDLDPVGCTMLVHLLCTMHRVEEAFLELEDMIRRGIVPHSITYQRMTYELKEQGKIEMTRKLCDMMATTPHLIKLPSANVRDEDASRARRTSIIQKAKALSNTLKTCRDPRELVKRRKPSVVAQ